MGSGGYKHGLLLLLRENQPGKGRTQPHAKFILHPVLKSAMVGLQHLSTARLLKSPPFRRVFYLWVIVSSEIDIRRPVNRGPSRQCARMTLMWQGDETNP
jgi:hypothetical protein